MKEVLKHFGIAFIMFTISSLVVAIENCGLDIKQYIIGMGVIPNVILYMMCYFLEVMLWYTFYGSTELAETKTPQKTTQHKRVKKAKGEIT